MDTNRFLLSVCIMIALVGCGGVADEAIDTFESESPDTTQDDSADVSLASNGCSNVVISAGVAYAACGEEIEVAQLDTLDREIFFSSSADDITIDAQAGLMFTQSGNLLTVFDLVDPLAPNVLSTTTTNFAAFSGISAANGLLVVSGGAGGSNTEVYLYSDASEPISIATFGIPAIDNTTGNPDVHLSPTAAGATAFYSQDIGAVANFAIQIAELNAASGAVLSVSEDIVLTPGAFSFNSAFAPANFPVESEFLDDRLYVAHFAAEGIEVIDLVNGNELLPTIELGYEPTNIATDGEMLFVVGLENDTVDVIDPATSSVVDSLVPAIPFSQPIGVAASATHVAVADRENGLVIIAR